MAKRGFGYFDRMGNYFKTAAEATQSDIAALFGTGDNSSCGAAQLVCDNRAAIERIFAEHDAMLAQEDDGESRAHDHHEGAAGTPEPRAQDDRDGDGEDINRVHSREADRHELRASLTTSSPRKVKTPALAPVERIAALGDHHADASEDEEGAFDEAPLELSTVFEAPVNDYDETELEIVQDDEPEDFGEGDANGETAAEGSWLNGSGASLTDMTRRSVAKRPARLR